MAIKCGAPTSCLTLVSCSGLLPVQINHFLIVVRFVCSAPSGPESPESELGSRGFAIKALDKVRDVALFGSVRIRAANLRAADFRNQKFASPQS